MVANNYALFVLNGHDFSYCFPILFISLNIILELYYNQVFLYSILLPFYNSMIAENVAYLLVIRNVYFPSLYVL